MSYVLIPLAEAYLETAVELFIENYRQEKEHSPLLPNRVIEEPAWLYRELQPLLANASVAVVEQNKLLAFMVTGEQFQWKGQQAAIILEHGHGAVRENRQELYQRMYMYLAQQWVNQGVHLHLIRHFAHDIILQETLFQLGFGAILAERLRDLSSTVEERPTAVIRIEPDISKLLTIQLEHNRYYFKSPIFIGKSTNETAVLADLEEQAKRGDVFFVYDEQGEPGGYFIVGESAIGEEGFLLERTNTAQIKSAYLRPEIRRKGVGVALLERAIEWAQQQGYERLFVEHETANFYGGNFWSKYFSPFLYSSMRYTDATLDKLA